MDESAYLNDNEWERKQWLRPELIAPWWEIAFVLAVMLGPFAYSSIAVAAKNHSHDFIHRMVNDRNFLLQTAVEGGLLCAFFFYLHWRGWKPSDFKIRIDWKHTLLMPALAVVAGLANVLTTTSLKFSVIWLAPHPHGIAAAFHSQSPHIPRHSIDVAWAVIILVSVVNAYLEELVFMGYAFNQFAAKRNPLFALLCMVFLRMLLHIYKGPLEMLGIASFSFVYGLAYWRLRRLWPLILGHISIDILAFSLLKIIFGR